MTENEKARVPIAVPPTRGGMREVAVLAYPVVLSQLSSSLMHVIDSMLVGRLGPTELGAVGYGGIWLWTVLTIFMGTSTGVQTFVAQADGAGNHDRCGYWTWQGLYALLPVTALGIGVFAWLFPAVIGLLGPSAELQENATVYVRARSMGCVGLAIWMVLGAFFRGLGDTRTPLIASVVANVANAIFDYGLIFGKLGLPELGIQGAGIATAIGEWLGAVVLVIAFAKVSLRRYGTAPCPVDMAGIRRFVRTSAPIGGQWSIEMAAFALFSTLVARMGDAAMAASQALIALLSLSFMQAIGISMASATLVGRYIGARDLESAERGHRSAITLSLALGGAIALFLLFAPEVWIRLFTDDVDVIRFGAPLIMVGAIFQVFDALQIVSSGSLRGGGDTRWPFLVQSGLAWGLSLPLAYLGGVVLDGGVIGAWIALLIYVGVLSGCFLWRFASGAWREIRI